MMQEPLLTLVQSAALQPLRSAPTCTSSSAYQLPSRVNSLSLPLVQKTPVTSFCELFLIRYLARMDCSRTPSRTTENLVTTASLSVKNRLDEVKFRCFPVKRTLRRQECTPRRSGGERTVYLS